MVLLVLLSSVAATAAWRTHKDKTMRDSLGHRSAAVAAIEKARAASFLDATLITAAAFAEDPAPFFDSWHQAIDEVFLQQSRAQAELTALGDTDALAALDSFTTVARQTAAQLEAIINSVVTTDVSTRVRVAQQEFPQLWDKSQANLAELDGLASGQEATLVADQAAADSSAKITLTLILGLSAFAFLAGAATMSWLFASVVRPLAALQTSAKAVAAGDLSTRVRVAGPAETASLARTFNDMVAQRKQVEESLLESEARYRAIFENIQDMYFRTDAQGIIVEVSPSVERWRYKRTELIGTPVMDLYADPEEGSALLKKLAEEGGEISDYEIRLKVADGHAHASSVSCHILRDADGTFIGVEGIVRNIDERKQAEEALHELSRRDPLTGVLNQRAIRDEMNRLISTSEHAAVAMVDVDRLKDANDTYGHQMGDAVLMAVTAALSRDDALVGRYGGDEFVAILPGADRNAAEHYHKNVTAALASTAVTDPQTGATMHASASIGLSVYPEDGSTITDLIRVSDKLMYAAKRQQPFQRPSPHKRASDRDAA